MTQQSDVGLVASSATEGIELSNTLMVPRPLKFFIVQNVTAGALVFGPLDIGLDMDIALKGHNRDSASNLLIKTHTWYAQCRCPPISLYGPGLVLSVAQHVFLAMSNMTTVVSEKDWLSFMCANLRQPWPPPFGVHSSAFLIAAHMLDNLQVELVQLQPWPSWQLFLSFLTMMGYFCDILVSTSSEVKWKNRLVLNKYGSWSNTMLFHSPSQISGQSCAIPDTCYKCLILCGGIESKIIILQFLGGLPERYWSSKFYCKGKQLLHCASGHTITLHPAVASGHSEIVPSLQARGTRATAVFDLVASVYLVVSSAHTVLNFPGTQPSQVLVLCLALNQIIEYSTDTSSWIDATPSVDHAIQGGSELGYSWHYFELELLVDGFLHTFVSRNLSGYIIPYGSEHIKLHIAGLFSQPLLKNWVQLYPTRKALLYDSTEFQWQIAWSIGLVCSDACKQYFTLTLRDYLAHCMHRHLHQATGTMVALNIGQGVTVPWDPGGGVAGLRASRILWRGDCQRPLRLDGIMGRLVGLDSPGS